MGRHFKQLQQSIGYKFSDSELLRRALSHRSWIAESDDVVSNERLEFLGDAVLGWVVADLVYSDFEDWDEGVLTDLRKSVVNASALAEVARDIDLGTYLLLGNGEDAAGGRNKESILSDALEAVFGAVYIDAGSQQAFDVVRRLIAPRLAAAPSRLDRLDQKSTLQELLASLGRPSPSYTVTAQGPDHDKEFTATVVIDGDVLGTGIGRSKKLAEQQAAGEAIDALHASDHA
ncbi:MAG: ribonuclease III [Ilumatobacteraceae bacterium]